MIEERYIYHPSNQLEGSPGDLGLEFQEARFSAADGTRLHGWLVPGDRNITWVWFHGNAGNISHRLEDLKVFHDQLGVGIFIFDYRGFGASEGKPSERGLYQDGEAALEWLREHPAAGRHRHLLLGRSLGCAIAVEMARRHPPWRLVLDAPFSSIRAMANDRGRWAGLLSWVLFRSKFDSLRKIKEVRAPVLVCHGDRDETIPFYHGRRLFEAANEPKSFYTIANGGHTDACAAGGPEYFATLEQFMEVPERER